MAYSGTGRVTVVSLASGQPLPSLSEGDSRSILNEPAIITLQGTPALVAAYQQQGDDLILRFQGSDAVRYQQFFSQVDGRHSELHFQQDNAVQKVQFVDTAPGDSTTLITLLPVLSAPEGAATDVSTSALPETHSAATASIASNHNDAADTALSSDVLPVSTLTAAPSTTPSTLVVAANEPRADALPVLHLDPIADDNAVNYQEGVYGILFAGTTEHLPTGSIVTVTLNGKSWGSAVYENQWHVNVNDSELRDIKDGNYRVTVSVADEQGNSTSLSRDLLLITHYNSGKPTVTVNDVTLADAVEHDGQTWYRLTGTLEAPLPIKSFAVQSDYLMNWHHGVPHADGSWSVEVSASDISEGNNSLTFGVQDGAGNWLEQELYVSADLTTPAEPHDPGEVPLPGDNPGDTPPVDGGDTTPPPVSGPPSLTIHSFTGDAVLSADEKLTAQTLSGTTQNLAPGSTLTVQLNGESYTTTLAADGSWSLAIPAADLQTLPVGSSRISVSFENSVGGTTTLSKAITVEASVPPDGAPVPQPTIETPFGDGLMSSAESYHAQMITGTTGVTGAGQKIALTIDGISYAGTVDTEGRWSVPVGFAPNHGAPSYNGKHEIVLTATDVWGQTGTAVTHYIADVEAPRVSVNVLAGDGLIDLTEINSPLLISGNGERGCAIEVTFGSTVWKGTIDSYGEWQFTVPAETLQSMGEGYFGALARVTDAAGNSSFDVGGVDIYASEVLPQLTLDPVTGDNAVSYQEGIYGIMFTGSAAHLPSGTLIDLTLNGKTFYGSVNENEWRVQISNGDVKSIKDGNYAITVSATDPNGNSTSLSQDLLLITHYNSSNPTFTVNPLTLADAVEHDGQTWYRLTGTMEAPLPIQYFSVQSDYLANREKAVIHADGSWSVEIRAEDINEYTNTMTFGVFDDAGNWFEQDINVQVDLITPAEPHDPGEVPVPGDNPGDTPPVDGGDTPPSPVSGPPSLIIHSFTGDAVLSAEEKQSAQTLSGTTQNLAPESTLTVKLNGESYTTTLAADGSWSVTIPAADLQGLPVGTNRISVSFDNSVGGVTTAVKNITVEASLPPDDAPTPQPTIETPFGDGLMNAEDRSHPVTLTGTTGVTGAGQKIALTIDGIHYAGTVDSEGRWSVPLSSDQLHAANLGDGAHQIELTATDVWGQTGTATTRFTTDTQGPAIDINLLSDDGVIDFTEINAPLVISGSGEAGSTIEVTFGSIVWNSTIDSSGHWQFTVPAETLQSMGEGRFTARVHATDAAGNSAVTATEVKIYPTEVLPQLTLDPVTGDNAVSYQEGVYGIMFTGSAAHLPSDTRVELTLDGKTFVGNVAGDEWRVEISDADVRSIKDGNYTITVSATDPKGNSASLSQDLLLITHYNSSFPTLTVNTLTLADAVEHDGQTWYRLTGTIETPLPIKSFSVQSDFLANHEKAVIHEDGSWSVDIRADDINQHTNTMTFGVFDGAGNWFEKDIVVPVDLTPPVDGGGPILLPAPTIDTPFDDGWLNRSEKQQSETLTGTTGVSGSGQAVKVIIGGKTHMATVADDGKWSLTLTPEMMKTGFGNGKHAIIVTATDASAHSATINASYTVDACPPKISFSHLADGQRINLNEGLLIAGKGEAGDAIIVTLGDHHWQTNVTNAGTWNVQLDAAEAHTLASGDYALTASIQDAAGNIGHAALNVALYNEVAPPQLAVAPNDMSATVTDEQPMEVMDHSALENPGVNPDVLSAAGLGSHDAFSLLSLHRLTSPDASAEYDMLRMNGSHEALDFATLGLKISGVEAIDLGSAGSNSVTLGQKDLLQLSDNASDTLTIKGADGNAVTLSTKEGGVWQEDGQRLVDGQQYDLWHTTAANHEGSLADVLIQHNLQVHLV